ncbi:acyl--CoA ligase [Myxococcota bacterium]|nr:acyl--CoA ligase [Myxococcota bacterium]
MLAEVINEHASSIPDAPAFYEGETVLSWSEYASRSDAMASHLIELGLMPGERVAVLLPDGPGVHITFLALEKAGLVIVGLGPRAGVSEIRHLLGLTGASALISQHSHRDLDLEALFGQWRDGGLPLRHHVIVSGELGGDDPIIENAPPVDPSLIEARRLGPDDLWLLNSTSGTTGLPKCVTHHQGRWHYFHELAVESGELRGSDIFMSALPAPFGFGIWTAHVTPALLGAPTVLMSDFTAERMIECIEQHSVTVLAAVSTQFIMLLNSEALESHDVRSIRALYTGGEAVPTDRAAEFEEKAGAFVLQFYGSNETGALSRTTTQDSRAARLETAGRVIDGMQVRLFDDANRDVTESGQGQPGCRGPATSHGYYGDEEANRKLYTPDGWMLTGDIATLDTDGYLRVIGRVADFIIRGGKNISGPAVEECVMTHPAVGLAAAVAMPDPVFGERVCVYAELRASTSLTLDDLIAHLAQAGVSREIFPERLEIVDSLPRASGGKIAKQQLREDIKARLEAESGTTEKLE